LKIFLFHHNPLQSAIITSFFRN